MARRGAVVAATITLGSLFWTPPALADMVLRASRDMDIQRVGGVGVDEKRLLRAEWKVGFTHDEEMSLIGDMLTRLGRIEVTVNDLRRTIENMPVGPRPAAPAVAPLSPVTPVAAPAPKPAPKPAPVELDDDDEPVPSPFGLNLQTGLAGGTLALLIGFWLLRRRPATNGRHAAPTRATNGVKPREPAVPAAADTPPPAPPAAATTKTLEAAPETPAATTDDPSGNGEQQALELAEIMLSMGLASGAAQALTEHIQSNPKQALFHWLKLLDVYRRSGNKFQFEQASRELQQHFNVHPETWAQMSEGESASLENFTRVISHIQGIWNQPGEAISYLKHLLEDNRGGTRAGFPQPVAEEILLLVGILKETWGR
jgi:hypothetical protein